MIRNEKLEQMFQRMKCRRDEKDDKTVIENKYSEVLF